MAQPRLHQLGRRERQIVEAVHRLGRATVTDVLAALPDAPSYSAVRAMLGKLEHKGHLKHEAQGPRYVYLPAVSTARAGRAALRHLVNTFFDGSIEEAVLALIQISDTRLPAAVVTQLGEQVRQAEREGR